MGRLGEGTHITNYKSEKLEGNQGASLCVALPCHGPARGAGLEAARAGGGGWRWRWCRERRGQRRRLGRWGGGRGLEGRGGDKELKPTFCLRLIGYIVPLFIVLRDLARKQPKLILILNLWRQPWPHGPRRLGFGPIAWLTCDR